jgi:hypothetical protein
MKPLVKSKKAKKQVKSRCGNGQPRQMSLEPERPMSVPKEVRIFRGTPSRLDDDSDWVQLGTSTYIRFDDLEKRVGVSYEETYKQDHKNATNVRQNQFFSSETSFSSH